MRRLLGAIGLCSILLNLPVSAQPVPPSPPPPNHEIVPPGMQRPSADHPATETGSIEGFVYWDASLITHKPAGSCRGLVFTISLGSPTPDGMSTMFTRLATLSDNSKYIGQVKEFLANGVIVVYDVCAYSYDQAPVGRPLEIAVTLPDPLLFSPYVAPKIPTVAPVQIISGKCNMLPNIMNPTASDLAAHWGSCQKMAYDVNFQLAPAAHILSSGGSQLSSGSSNQSGVLSGTHSQGCSQRQGQVLRSNELPARCSAFLNRVQGRVAAPRARPARLNSTHSRCRPSRR